MKYLLILMTAVFLVSCSGNHLQFKGVRPEQGAFQVAWAKNHDPVYETGNLPIGLNSPLIYEGIVYAGSGDARMYAYDLKDGRIIWQAQDIGAQYSRPVVFKNLIIYGTVPGRVYARDLLTGKSAYEVDLGSTIETAGVVFGGRMVFHSRNHSIHCLDAITGKVLWTYRRSVPFLTTIQKASRPLIFKNKIVIGLADGHVAALRLEDGALIWEGKVNSGDKFLDVDTSPVLFNGMINVTSLSGDMVTLDPNSGVVVGRTPYRSVRAPLVQGDKLVISTLNGELVRLSSGLELEKKVALSSHGLSSFIPWKGGFAVADLKGNIFFVKDWKSEGRHELGSGASAVFGDMSTEADQLAVLSSRNRLYIFR